MPAAPTHRRIKKVDVKCVALVPRGANQLPVLYKEADKTAELAMAITIGKDFDEKGELLACVYAPEHRDSQGDIADAEVIKEGAYSHARNGGALDIRHDGAVIGKDRAYVAESFIIQKGDERFAGMKDYANQPVNAEGGWGMVIKIEDPALRKNYRDGKWNGVSLFGPAELEIEKSTDQVNTDFARRLIAKIKGGNGDIDMTPEQTAELIKTNNAELLKGIGTMFKDGIGEMVKALKPEAPATAAAAAGTTTPAAKSAECPAFKGDPLNIADVRKHQAAVARFELTKNVNWSDAASVAEYGNKITELDKAAKEAAAANGGGDTNAAQIAALEQQISALKKSSSQGSGDASNPGASAPAAGAAPGLSKEDQDLFKIGMDWSHAMNGVKKTA